MRNALILAALFMAAGAEAADRIAEVNGAVRIVRTWPGGVWPVDGKHYAAGTFEYYNAGEVVIRSGASAVVAGGSNDALAEVNARRARRGLRPFIYDPGLTAGAEAAARARASTLTAGHTRNDFAYLPPGTSARAAGCAAWAPGSGWGSCCSDDNYTYAGAGWAMGRDGRRYMHLFVR